MKPTMSNPKAILYFTFLTDRDYKRIKPLLKGEFMLLKTRRIREKQIWLEPEERVKPFDYYIRIPLDPYKWIIVCEEKPKLSDYEVQWVSINLPNHREVNYAYHTPAGIKFLIGGRKLTTYNPISR
ncbi:hypothetical protein V6R21_18965 [Limibacter armeniacum]|uniref:hypothetical protein n=1 Tax=Limibacter armeniacum TaxID=466084 RepID=UPI002FE68361